MEMPQELEMWYVIPAIRKELTKILYKKGKKQKEISNILNISKSAVSQYLKEKRAKGMLFNEEIEFEIKKSAEEIIKDKKSLMAEIQRICMLIRKSRILCEIHKKREKELDYCDICLK